MAPPAPAAGASIFVPATRRERAENFEGYWAYLQQKNGELFEREQALAEKQRALGRFREHAVRSRRPLTAPELFYRNNVVMRDDPRALDRTTLLLTFLYKFARHEWVGISAAWDVTPTLADSVYVTDKIRVGVTCGSSTRCSRRSVSIGCNGFRWPRGCAGPTPSSRGCPPRSWRRRPS